MITPRCILNCGYCFRDTTPESIKSELDLNGIKKVIDHLYNNFNVRKLTLSGGEPTVLGGVRNTNFLEIIDYIKKYKFPDTKDNLRIELLSNGINITKEITDALIGVVERITITLDSLEDSVLLKIGRNTNEYKDYVKKFWERFEYFDSKGFQLKIHSVISPVNYDSICELVKVIVAEKRFKVTRWKFYQYMTYGQPEKDIVFELSDDKYRKKCKEIARICEDSGIELSFKDNKIMVDTMINLIHSGRIESFTMDGDNRMRHLSKIITEYPNIEELIKDNRIDIEMFNKYHSIII
jgi:molybdenum cofactor biosynthesis enzyme MoaA